MMIDANKQEKNIERFEMELSHVKRAGIESVQKYIRESDFYMAPTSTKFHLSVPGGLLQHSLNVLDALRSILTKDGCEYSYCICGKNVLKDSNGKPTTISEESVIIMALLHDICKTEFYQTEMRNRKNKITNAWESYATYVVDDKHPLGHGEKSVIMLSQFGLKLLPDELYAIRWHMGFPQGNDMYTFSAAVEKYPIIWAMHTADLMTSHFMENTENNNEDFIESIN